MANLIQTNNANVKIFGAKLSAGTASSGGGGGGGGGGGPTATFWSNWTSLPNYNATGTANFTVNGNNLEIDDRTGLTSFNSGYTYKGGSIDARNCSNLTSLNIGYNNLTSVDVTGLSALTNLNVGGNSLTTLDLSGLTSLTQLYLWYMFSLTSITNLSQATNITHVYATGSGLPESVVNYILTTIDGFGTSSGFISIQYGTSAAPTGAGLTAKANLQSRGWSVYTNN